VLVVQLLILCRTLLGLLVKKSYNNARLTFVVSVCPHETNPEVINGILLNLIPRSFTSLSQHIPVSDNISSDGYFTCRLACVFVHIWSVTPQILLAVKLVQEEVKDAIYELCLITLAVFEIIKQSGANAQEVLSCAHIS